MSNILSSSAQAFKAFREMREGQSILGEGSSMFSGRGPLREGLMETMAGLEEFGILGADSIKTWMQVNAALMITYAGFMLYKGFAGIIAGKAVVDAFLASAELAKWGPLAIIVGATAAAGAAAAFYGLTSLSGSSVSSPDFNFAPSATSTINVQHDNTQVSLRQAAAQARGAM